MNEQKKQKLLEQYDDAAFALLMDEYAEEEGARLMAEFEAAQAAGQVPEMPAELDEQCRRMIRRDRAKKRGIRAARSFRKVAVKVAVAVLVFIGLMTTVVMSVDALRVPVLNFIVEHFNNYSSASFESNTPTENHNPTTNYPSIDLFESIIPQDYTLVSQTITENLALIAYENNDLDTIQLCITPAKGEVRLDTEDAIYSEVILYNYKAILLEKNGYQVFWHDEKADVLYTVIATALTKEAILEICYTLDMHSA